MNCQAANCNYNFGHSNFLQLFWHLWSLSVASDKKRLKTVGWVPVWIDICQFKMKIVNKAM